MKPEYRYSVYRKRQKNRAIKENFRYSARMKAVQNKEGRFTIIHEVGRYKSKQGQESGSTAPLKVKESWKQAEGKDAHPLQPRKANHMSIATKTQGGH